ncbi:BREX-1 system phosphatase PglZ type A [Oceanobacillus kimchii]|uniref:BREX-1 system phosphatase PglZ type A n=1 Tax=Oceanobacillus kimchii TaxID=746691 RepID=UPI0021A923AD|nr:BREX-1 system phosphatase PglZ type A [Oceanobacillus kimchii]MCT1577053.1 BREX-1 system phosphatase PglZ type A [Oceanobacillus kimchii]
MSNYLDRLQVLLQQEKKDKGRAIIFWIENEGEWSVEDLQRVIGTDAIVRLLAPNHSLKLKREIERENVQSSFILYSPSPLSDEDLEPILSLRLSGVDFQHDDVYVWAERFQTDEWNLRKLMEQYSQFFTANTRLNKLEKYRKKYPHVFFDERLLIYTTVNSKPTIEEAFIQLVKMGTNITNHKLYKELNRFGLINSFVKHLSEAFGISTLKESNFLEQGIYAIIASAYFQDGGPITNNLAEFKSNKMNWLAGVYNKIAHSDEFKSQLSNWTVYFVEKYNIKEQLVHLTNQQLVRFKNLLLVDEIILNRIYKEAYETNIEQDINHLCAVIEQRLSVEFVRKNSAIYSYYSFWKNYINLRTELNKNISKVNIRPTSADLLYTSYIEKTYRIDQYVRNLNNSLRNIREEEYHDLVKIIQIRYERDWLQPMSVHASSLIKQAPQTSLKQQTSFYETYVHKPKLQTKARQYVIISDGFRYEAGKELAEQLQYDSECKVSCEAMLSSLPSYTQLGMASLLPQIGEMNIKSNKRVYIGDRSTSGNQQRERVLKEVDENSIIFRLSDFLNLLSKERKERVKGKSIVYLFHDVIDAVGDKNTTEHHTYDMTCKAITELNHAIQTLLNMEAKRITITADHGFLYLSEQSSTATKVLNERRELLDGNNRFQMVRKGVQSSSVEYGAFLLNSNNQVLTDTDTIITEGLNRFRTGAGTRYFHGGVTPQERVVPVLVIESQQDVKRVDVSIVDNNWVISDYNPKFILYQSEIISEKVLPTKIRTSLWLDGECVSNKNVVTCKAKTKQEQEQVFSLYLFEQNYPLHGTLTLLLETSSRNGRWERYRTYTYKVGILGGYTNE